MCWSEAANVRVTNLEDNAMFDRLSFLDYERSEKVDLLNLELAGFEVTTPRLELEGTSVISCRFSTLASFRRAEFSVDGRDQERRRPAGALRIGPQKIFDVRGGMFGDCRPQGRHDAGSQIAF